MKKKYNFLSNLVLINQIGITMLVSVALGIWIGGFLDDKLNTGVLFLIVFTIIGVASGFRSVYLIVTKQIEKEEEEKDD